MPPELPPAADVIGTLSIAKTVVMAVLLLPWLWAAPWVCHDIRGFHGRGKYWPLCVVGAGAASVLLWLIVPFYAAGLLIYVVVVGGILTAYVVWHNSNAKPTAKLTFDTFVSRLTHRRRRHVNPDAVLDDLHVVSYVTFYDAGEHLVSPSPADPEVQDGTYNLAQAMFYEIIRHRASEAEIAPSQPHVTVRMVVDGELVNLNLQWEPPQGEAVIQYLKRIGGMTVDDRRRPQKGSISVDQANRRMDVSLACAGTTGGQRMQFLVIQEAARTDLDELGMSPEVLEKIRRFTEADSGLLIVAGQPKSGITSTMYSILRQYDAFLKQLVTIEARARVDMENTTQNEYGAPDQQLDVLASVLRRHPDVVLVDRCGDNATAELISESAAMRPTLLGVHGSDTFVALARWIKACGSADRAVQHLYGITCQILLKRLCPDCREGYTPDPNLLAKANLTGMAIDRFYRARTKQQLDEQGNAIACPTCEGTGYVGRVGAFELLEMTDELRQMVRDGAPLAQIKSACRKSKMLYLQEQALNKVVEGVTGVKEVIRATRKGEGGKTAGEGSK